MARPPRPPIDAGLRVRTPFNVVLEHRELGAREMFRVSRAFDFHEVDDDARLTVDVESVQPTKTTLHVTPQQPMAYEEIADEVADMLESLGPEVFGEQPRLAEVDWVVERHGEHSQGRENLGRIL